MGWKKTRNVNTKTTEPSAFVDIGGYVHQDEGNAKVKLYVGNVDEPLKVDDAAITKRLKRIRVTMNVTEDKTPKENCVYEKNAFMEQREDTDGELPPNDGQPTSSEFNLPPNPITSPDDFKVWAKNNIDLLWIGTGFAIATAVLGVGVLLGHIL